MILLIATCAWGYLKAWNEALTFYLLGFTFNSDFPSWKKRQSRKKQKGEGTIENKEDLWLKVLFNLVQIQAICIWIPGMEKALILDYTSK